VRLGIVRLVLVGEQQRLAGPWIVNLDVRSFAAAARRVDELGRAGARLLGKELDAERLASRIENRVLRVGVLREQARDRRRRPERSVGIRPAWKRIIGAAALRDEQRGKCQQQERRADARVRQQVESLSRRCRGTRSKYADGSHRTPSSARVAVNTRWAARLNASSRGAGAY
jgi:hypothetical protein